MVIYRSLGVARLVALMAAHRGKSAHDRLLARLDRSVDEARELCTRAQDLYPEVSYTAIAGAFETVLARPAQDWLHRAEALVGTVRTGSDTICGARAKELRVLIDHANVAMMRQPTGREAWRNFYRSVLTIEKAAQKSGN
jgi:hypothetical protein